MRKMDGDWKIGNKKQILLQRCRLQYASRHYVEDMVIIKLIKLFTKKLKYILNHSFFLIKIKVYLLKIKT